MFILSYIVVYLVGTLSDPKRGSVNAAEICTLIAFQSYDFDVLFLLSRPECPAP